MTSLYHKVTPISKQELENLKSYIIDPAGDGAFQTMWLNGKTSSKEGIVWKFSLRKGHNISYSSLYPLLEGLGYLRNKHFIVRKSENGHYLGFLQQR